VGEPELCFASVLPFSCYLCNQVFSINVSPLSYTVPEPEWVTVREKLVGWQRQRRSVTNGFKTI